MAVLGFDPPVWVTILEQKGPEIALAVMAEIPTLRELVIDADPEHGRVIAIGTSRHHDHYGLAYELTEQLASLWAGFVDETIGLRINMNALQVDVPGRFFTDPGEGVRRRRWATLASTRLVASAKLDVTRRPGCLGGLFAALFIGGGGIVLILQSVASTEPRDSRSYDDVHNLASLVTVVWLLTVVVVAVVWLLAIVNRPEEGD